MLPPSKSSGSFAFDNHEGEIKDPEVPIENVAMATKIEDVWNWLGHSRNSEIPHSLEIPRNDIVENFQSAMILTPKEVEDLVDKATDLKNLPFPKASDEEILQFEEILQRNAAARCPPKSLAKEIMPVKLEGLYANNNDVRTSSIARSGPSPPPVSTYNKNDAKKKCSHCLIGCS